MSESMSAESLNDHDRSLEITKLVDLAHSDSNNPTPPEKRIHDLKSTQAINDWLACINSSPICSSSVHAYNYNLSARNSNPQSLVVLVTTQNSQLAQKIIDLTSSCTISLESRETYKPSIPTQDISSNFHQSSDALENTFCSQPLAFRDDHRLSNASQGSGSVSGADNLPSHARDTSTGCRMRRGVQPRLSVSAAFADGCIELDYIEKPSGSQIEEALDCGIVLEKSIANRRMKLPKYLAGMHSTIRRPQPQNILSYLGWARNVSYVTCWSDGHVTTEPAKFLKDNYPHLIQEWRKLKRRSSRTKN